MSTPRTDAVAALPRSHERDPYQLALDLARQLEHELAEARIAIHSAKWHLDYCGYGDSFQRDYAAASGLPELMERAARL